MKYETKHRNYRIETTELEDGSVDIQVSKSSFFGLSKQCATTTTKTFDNHTQAVKFAKNSINNREIPF